MEYWTSDSDESCDDRSTLDLSYMGADASDVNPLLTQANSRYNVTSLLMYHNELLSLPDSISQFPNLRYLDVSSNQLTELPEALCACPLVTILAKNNHLSSKSLPPGMSKLTRLRELNLNGNQFHEFPPEVFQIPSIKFLYLGANKIKEIPSGITQLTNLEILALGGNLLTDVPASVGQLTRLTALVLSDNQLHSLPSSIANLNNLKSLLLHKNRLRMLPTEIIALQCLTELSLRDNPLVVRFVSDMMHSVPSMLELAARTIKLHNINYNHAPKSVIEYLNSAHHCINPNCKGVFFDNRVEHVKFVDFCGKYRVPLLQYLCSANCIDDRDDVKIEPEMLRKVLLG